ncbi:hypothetical protein EYF80_001541 [Liparis tanakae]|uniref:Uncharacterized protein n=1 Tax=Liparis tanakae TaxID=230148 RepID=A0A4Z2JDG5_9TELE|nr:hypothetical protein EYF80_001541 [Liparis tanakae]
MVSLPPSPVNRCTMGQLEVPSLSRGPPAPEETQLCRNQTDINAASKRDTSSSGILLIGTENARLHTSDCVAPTSINLIDWEPR